MKSLYEFIAKELGLIKVYYLSYDITSSDTLDDNNFALFLYNQEIVTTDVEFQVLERNNDNLEEKPTYYIIKPAESSIVFGSYKMLQDIADILRQRSEIDFAISQLEISKNKVSNLWVNNYDHGEQANESIRKAIDNKNKGISSKQKRQQELMNYPPKSNRIIYVQKLCKY